MIPAFDRVGGGPPSSPTVRVAVPAPPDSTTALPRSFFVFDGHARLPAMNSFKSLFDVGVGGGDPDPSRTYQWE